jgi:hypothetical protein
MRQMLCAEEPDSRTLACDSRRASEDFAKPGVVSEGRAPAGSIQNASTSSLKRASPLAAFAAP